MKKIAVFFSLAIVSLFLLDTSPETSAKMSEKKLSVPSSRIDSPVLFSDEGKEWQLLKPYQAPEDLTFSQNRIVFKTAAETRDEWDYIYLDPHKYQWKNYSWQFSAIRHTKFREFAFNFRNLDFNNRYRYRFEDDKIFFDKIVKGNWTNNIASIPFNMELGKPYRIRIDSYGSVNRCWVDGRLMLENVDSDIPSGSIAIILWEDNGKTDIHAEVYDSRVVELI